MFATSSEIAQYIRMTLKQWGVSHLKIEWMDRQNFLGLAYVTQDRIKLNKIILVSFRLFDEVLKHEIAHCIQYKRNGNRFLTKNGRRILHGKDFAAVCKEMGIPARTRIPIHHHIYAWNATKNNSRKILLTCAILPATPCPLRALRWRIARKNLTKKNAVASSSKSKGSVKTVEWWKHLRDRKRAQNKLVRRDGKKQIEEEKK